MVMFCCCHPSSTLALLLVFLILNPLLAFTAPAVQPIPSISNSINEALRLAKEDPGSDRKVDHPLQDPLAQEQRVSEMDSANVLASVLLKALDHPVSVDQVSEEGLEMEVKGDQGSVGTEQNQENVEKLPGRQTREREEQEKPKQEESETESDSEGKDGLLLSLIKAESQANAANLQRKARGYFQNIDLGLQDNEILPPLKGYKAYNQQLAQATKKLKWQEGRTRPPSQLDRNFMDDFDFVEEEEEEIVTRKEEEARARAEQEEVRRQELEAQEAREEEQRLADIASDMLLEYMGRKPKASSYMRDMEKAALLNNVAEDKRSNEVDDDDDEMDPQTIDKLIEISSKLHLPADDVVEIISDVQEKKKKRKDLPLNTNNPRFRPLVPLKAKPRPQVYQYPKSPKKVSYVINPYKKWYKEKNKGKFNKQDFWFKPQKQFLAYPSFPYYQKPYRAYYPVFFPPPKPRFYTSPALAFDYNFGGAMGYGLKPPSRRYKDRPKARDWKWAQAPPRPQTSYPQPDAVISNYILPHPRTYQALPMPKPRSPPSARAPTYIYPPDYVYDEPEPPQDNDEELENFIEKIYYNRRLF